LIAVTNPEPADLNAGPQGPRVALLFEGKAVSGAETHGQAFPDTQRHRIRYACAIPTRGLVAGSYTVVVAPPRQDASGPRQLLQVFVLLPS
jgi:hypothetical protein